MCKIQIGSDITLDLKHFAALPQKTIICFTLPRYSAYWRNSGGTHDHALYLLHSSTIGVLAGFMLLIGQVERSKVSRQI